MSIWIETTDQRNQVYRQRVRPMDAEKSFDDWPREALVSSRLLEQIGTDAEGQPLWRVIKQWSAA